MGDLSCSVGEDSGIRRRTYWNGGSVEEKGDALPVCPRDGDLVGGCDLRVVCWGGSMEVRGDDEDAQWAGESYGLVQRCELLALRPHRWAVLALASHLWLV